MATQSIEDVEVIFKRKELRYGENIDFPIILAPARFLAPPALVE